jgi:ABC-type nitrate/sulfonate/bicarbonate transport system ATPase subunit
MIQVENLTFAYGHNTPIFSEFNWQVQSGEAWAVLGQSGCGKSTLLALLAGLVQPGAGRILIDDRALTRPRPYTGLIIQDYGLLQWATVRENVELGQRVRSFYGPDEVHTPREFKPEPVDPWLERLGLSAFATQYPGRISGGQRQRTAIARTLVLQPDLLLMDEPFSSLDAPTREGLQNLMLELWSEQNLTLIIVTHTIEEAAVLGQKILLLGERPNTHPVVVENPGARHPDFRAGTDYLAMCRELRERLQATVSPISERSNL